jgi:hypothetical protein
MIDKGKLKEAEERIQTLGEPPAMSVGEALVYVADAVLLVIGAVDPEGRRNPTAGPKYE